MIITYRAELQWLSAWDMPEGHIMAFISYVQDSDIPERDRVSDDDNIIRIHGVHSRVMRHHYDLYIELMRRKSPLTRRQREMIGVVVSAYNDCHY
jgi:hypothetical protein